MAGHSKWTQIKRKKAILDSKRGALFTRLSRAITLAVQSGGGDPDTNFSLRFAIQQARNANVPAMNIERAIKRGSGLTQDQAKFVSATYEARTPQNVALLIQCQSDNLNRTLTDVHTIVEGKYGGKLTGAGSVAWQFQEYGMCTVTYTGEYQNVALNIMELGGVLDVEQGDAGVAYVLSEREQLAYVAEKLSDKLVRVENAEFIFQPVQVVQVSPEVWNELSALIEALEDNPDVIRVWHNAVNDSN